MGGVDAAERAFRSRTIDAERRFAIQRPVDGLQGCSVVGSRSLSRSWASSFRPVRQMSKGIYRRRPQLAQLGAAVQRWINRPGFSCYSDRRISGVAAVMSSSRTFRPSVALMPTPCSRSTRRQPSRKASIYRPRTSPLNSPVLASNRISGCRLPHGKHWRREAHDVATSRPFPSARRQSLAGDGAVHERNRAIAGRRQERPICVRPEDQAVRLQTGQLTGAGLPAIPLTRSIR